MRLGPRGRSSARAAFAFGVSLVLVLLFYGQNLHYALLGHDTYPIIATARIQSFGDLAGTFTRELMDGRYPGGRFYRPVLNLSFALDYAVWGAHPFGYHLTDLLILSASGCLLALLLRPVGRPGFGLRPDSGPSAGAPPPAGPFLPPAAVLAGLFFLLHPVHAGILPVAARRGDTLALLFILLALLSAARRGRAARWWPALFCLLAAGAKETGLLALPLLGLYAQPGAPEKADGGAALGAGPFKKACRAMALPAAAVLVFLAVRHAVLEGVGGHEALTWRAFIDHLLWLKPHFETAAFYRHPFLDFLMPEAAARAALLIIFAAASVTLLAGPGPRPAVRAALIFAWAWLILGWAVHGLSQAGGSWYTLHVVAPFALIFGIIVQEAVAALRDRRPVLLRAGLLLAALLLIAVFAVNTSLSPVFADYSRWRVLTDRVDGFFGDLAEKLAAAEPGRTVVALPLPANVAADPDAPDPRVPPIKGYTIQAWAELTFPGRKIRVALPVPRPAPPAADETLVLVPVP